MLVFLICLVPFAIPFIAKHFYPKDVTWVEMLGSAVISVLMAAGIYYASLYSEMSDELVLNGAVTSKTRDEVHCRHSYSCPPCYTTYSGSGKHRTSHRHCATCYSHPYDVDWIVHSSLGNFDVDTVDRQGLVEPKLWTSAYVKEPVAKTMEYTNYVKGAKNSLFNLKEFNSSKEAFPNYPIGIYSLYQINRVVSDGVSIPDAVALNQGLSSVLSRIGAIKQVNTVLVFTKKDVSYAHRLKAKWLGARKNDLVVVIGAKNYPTVDWVNVFGWSKNEMVYIKLRDDIMALQTISPVTLMPVLESDISKYYVRHEMKDFEYLKDSIEPSNDTILWALGISMFFSILFSWVSIKYEII